MAGPPPVPPIPLPGWFASLTPAPAPGASPPPPPPPPAWGVGGPDMPGTRANPLTQAQADALFKDLANPGNNIPFNWPYNGCYARAHEMRRLMEGKGIESEKLFIYGNLIVTGPSIPGGVVTWGYHVAPTIQVQGKDGKPVSMVIDPSLSDKPLTNEEWKGMQGDTKARLEAAPGHVVYKPEGAPLDDPRISRDDDYSRTAVELAGFRKDRADWDAAHPAK
jgi:hypothetical protein